MIKTLPKHKKYSLHPNWINTCIWTPFPLLVICPWEWWHKHCCCYFNIKLKKGSERKEISVWFLTFRHVIEFQVIPIKLLFRMPDSLIKHLSTDITICIAYRRVFSKFYKMQVRTLAGRSRLHLPY